MTSSDLRRILDFPKVHLGAWPTPISVLPHSGTTSILVKRDDLSGHGRGGVKTRKIEHLIGYMLANGYDEFITVVANVTNLIHDILPVLQQYGLQRQLFIINDPPLPSGDRDIIFRDVREHVHLLGPGRLRVASSIMIAALNSRKSKRRPFIALPSLSHPAGVVGNAQGFIEMVTQMRANGQPLPGRVYITVASGTTFAGFLLAENALRQEDCPPIRIIGVQVYPGQARLWTIALIRWTERFLGLRGRVPYERIELITSHLYGGFGRYPTELSELCLALRRDSGVSIDPIFGGKTWSVMESHLALDANGDNRPVLYWHCGYTPDWQALGESINHHQSGTS